MQELIGDDPHAAFAHDRLDQDRGRCRPDGALHGLEIAERNLVETLRDRAKAIEVLLVAAGGERRQRAAVERSLERNDAISVGMARCRVVFARHLDGALHRFGTGIAKEHQIGKRGRAQPIGQALGLGDAVEVGDVPDLLGLLVQRRQETRMRMPQHVNSDAAGEVQVALVGGGDEPSAFSTRKCEVNTGVGRQ